MTKGEISAFCVVFVIMFAALISGIILSNLVGILLGVGGLILALTLIFSKLSQKRA